MTATSTAQVIPLREQLQVHKPDAIEWLNIFIYGDPGAGKTKFCGTAADHKDTRPVLLIDIEGGTMSIRDKDVDVVSARSLEQVQKIFNTLKKAGDKLEYKTVCVDSLSELQKIDMVFIMKEAKRTAKNPDLVNEDVPSMREWGISLNHMRVIVRAFRDLPCNTIITALAHSHKADENSIERQVVNLAGKSRNELPGFMDIFGYLYAQRRGQETERRLQLAKTQRIDAKDRTDLLGEQIEGPTIPLIWDTVKGSK
jgi:phage nucleotide-binding protein